MVDIRNIFVLSSIMCMTLASNSYNLADEKAKVSFKVEGCNEVACNQSCRRLYFSEGNCEGDRCDCKRYRILDKMLKDLDKMEDNLKTSKTVQADSELYDCTTRVCNQECQLIGFSNGGCVDDKCFCRKYEEIDTTNSSNSNQSSNKSVNCNRTCNKDCQLVGSPSGVCVNGQCSCEQIRANENSTPGSDENVISELSNCHQESCNTWCKHFDFSRGVCIKGKCDCKRFKAKEKTNLESDEYMSKPEVCNNRACNEECLLYGFPRGACFNGICDCDKFNGFVKSNQQGKDSRRSYKKFDDINVSNDIEDCDDQVCNKQCRYLGFSNGGCVSNKCDCDPSKTDEHISKTNVCNNRDCRQECQLYGFPNGVCFNGNCDCESVLKQDNNEDESRRKFKIEEDTQVSDEREDCSERACNGQCQQLGFSSGGCVNNKCDCTRSKTKTISSKHDENTSTPDDCDDQACHKECQRFGFTSGVCSNGNCDCDSFKGVKNIEDETAKDKRQKSHKGMMDKVCKQQCQRLGFTSGNCINGKINCDGFKKKSNKAFDREHNQILDCTNSTCVVRCIHLGFSSGICVANGTCDCNVIGANYRRTSTYKSEINECKKDCLYMCQSLNFLKGICVNQKCECHGFKEDDMKTLTNENHNQKRINQYYVCNNQTCYDHCIHLEMVGGSCINDTCDCKLRTEEVSDMRRNKDSTKTKCTLEKCNKLCQRYNFPSGDCEDGKCVCNQFHSHKAKSSSTSSSVESDEDFHRSLSCNDTDCNSLCQRLSFSSGGCIDDKCDCNLQDYEFNRRTANNEKIINQIYVCDNVSCDQHCRDMSFSSGMCINESCDCNIKEDTNENSISMECSHETCSSMCWQRDFHGGVCEDDKCVCEKLTSNLKSAKYTYKYDKDVIEPNGCKNDCSEVCHSLSFLRGMCVNKKCECNGFKEKDLMSMVDEKSVM